MFVGGRESAQGAADWGFWGPVLMPQRSGAKELLFSDLLLRRERLFCFLSVIQPDRESQSESRKPHPKSH